MVSRLDGQHGSIIAVLLLTAQPKSKLESRSDVLAVKPSMGGLRKYVRCAEMSCIPIVDVEPFAIIDCAGSNGCSIVGDLLCNG